MHTLPSWLLWPLTFVGIIMVGFLLGLLLEWGIGLRSKPRQGGFTILDLIGYLCMLMVVGVLAYMIFTVYW